jgi:hypothetical protein
MSDTTTDPTPELISPAPNNDDIYDILSSSVGAAFGVYTNAGLSKLTNTPINNTSLVLSAGAGAVIGTTLHTLLNKESLNLMLVNSFVGATGAMVGCAAGILIAPKASNELNGILLDGGLAALGAGGAIAIKQALTQQPSVKSV